MSGFQKKTNGNYGPYRNKRQFVAGTPYDRRCNKATKFNNANHKCSNGFSISAIQVGNDANRVRMYCQCFSHEMALPGCLDECDAIVEFQEKHP